MATTIVPTQGNSPLMTQAGVGASPGYQALDVRRMTEQVPFGEGVKTYGSYLVAQRGAGANMSVDISMDDAAYIRGDAITLQSLYPIPPHSATINETVAASDPTNPRIDRVIVQLQDTTHDASGQNRAQTQVLTGTPSVGATLDNLTGAAAVPASALLLADVLVPAASSSVTNANIRDRRPFIAGVPPLLTDVDMIPCIPDSGLGIQGFAQFASGGGPGDLSQFAYLFTVPRRIVAATRIRWKYEQGSVTAVTGNYVFGIYDASGRKIIDTGSIAFTGAAASVQVRSETIAATTLEPGSYYMLFGVDYTNAGAMQCNAVSGGVNTGGAPTACPSYPNIGLRSASGGVTAPTTILGFTDIAGMTTGVVQHGPIVALSVG